MPSGYLHQRCARHACRLSGVTPVAEDVMTLGAQGPDPLFTLGIFPLRRDSAPVPLGSVLHKSRTGAFLTALCRRAKDGSGIHRAYALGFLTHYALDSTVHPYVYAHSHRADGSYASQMHMQLEKQWDILYFRRDGHARGTPMYMPGVGESRAHWEDLAGFWAGAIAEVYPQETSSPQLVLDALRYSDRVNRLTHTPWGGKYALAFVLERLIGKPGMATSFMTPPIAPKGDLINGENRPWESPYEPGIRRTEGLEALFDAAVRMAADLLRAAADYFAGETSEGALSAAIGNRGYDSGLDSGA